MLALHPNGLYLTTVNNSTNWYSGNSVPLPQLLRYSKVLFKSMYLGLSSLMISPSNHPLASQANWRPQAIDLRPVFCCMVLQAPPWVVNLNVALGHLFVEDVSKVTR